MAERPRILRSLRALDALALAVTAAALAVTPAQAAVSVTAVGSRDPSVDGPLFALHRPGGSRRAPRPRGHRRRCPATTPRSAAGGVAWIDGANVVVAGRRRDPRARRRRASRSRRTGSPGAPAGALHAASLDPTQGFVAAPGRHRQRRQARRWPATCSCSSSTAAIEAFDLATGARTLLRREARAELRGPSVLGDRLTYVRATYKRQQVLTGPLVPRKRLERPHALRHDAHGPPRRRPRARPLPRQGPHQQAAVGAPARGRPRHADDDRRRARRAVYVTRVRQLRARTPDRRRSCASTSD